MCYHHWMAQYFEESRPHLRTMAYRILGSLSEADDAVQEAWIRLSSSDASEVKNLRGWLTTVVARVCLDMLRSRNVRREEPLEVGLLDSLESEENPEQEALVVDSVGLALLVVLDTLGPAERLAFVLHDMFAVPFDQIAVIVDRSPAAARQLASHARRRVQQASAIPDADPARRRTVVEAFLAASRNGDFVALLRLLHSNVVLQADDTAVAVSKRNSGGPDLADRIQGAAEVIKIFAGRAQTAELALVDGTIAAVWAPGRKARVVFAFTIARDKITAIDLVADPAELRRLDLTILNDQSISA